MAALILSRQALQQPQRPARVSSAIRPPLHLWSMVDGRPYDHAGGAHALTQRANVSVAVGKHGIATRGAGATGADSGFVSAISAAKLAGLTELTMFAVTEFDVFSNTECVLLRSDPDSAATGQIALAVFPSASNSTIRPLINTSGTSGWTTSVDHVIGALGAGPYLVIARYRSGQVLQSACIPIGSNGITWGGSFSPSGSVVSNDNMRIHIGGSANTGAGAAPGNLYLSGVFPYYISDAEVAALAQNPWQVFATTRYIVTEPVATTVLVGADAAQANSTTTGAAGVSITTAGANAAQANNGGTGALSVAGVLAGANSEQANSSSTGSLTGGINLSGANASQAGGSSTSALAVNVPLAVSMSVQYSFGSTGSLLGALTTPPLKNNTGAVLASQSGITVHIYQLGGALVATKTGQSTDTSGIMTINEPSLVSGTTYRLVIVMADGAEGMDKVAAV